MLDLQKDLGAAGEITIETILRAPGVLRVPEEELSMDSAWPHLEAALNEALEDLILMREKRGQAPGEGFDQAAEARAAVAAEDPPASSRRLPASTGRSLHERIQRAGIEIPVDDERLTKEVIFFADKVGRLRGVDPAGKPPRAVRPHTCASTSRWGARSISSPRRFTRELNTLGAKANDAEISQLVVTCKAEMEKIREQIQNIE